MSSKTKAANDIISLATTPSHTADFISQGTCYNKIHQRDIEVHNVIAPCHRWIFHRTNSIGGCVTLAGLSLYSSINFAIKNFGIVYLGSTTGEESVSWIWRFAFEMVVLCEPGNGWV
ncbi:MAG: hypothetical protein WAZ77_17095 [Candidatus Nitrosopolaris sp.]|jgi:hypothetical protein